MNNADLFLLQLKALGVTKLFGNPGTFEQQFLDALPRHTELEYIMSLHESIAIGAGIGYARMTKRAAFVQLHAAVGLGNSMGLLHEAYKMEVPLVVYVGENTQADEPYNGFLAADIPALAKGASKACVRITDPKKLAGGIVEAFQIANTAPYGPVVLTIPMDVMEAEAGEVVVVSVSGELAVMGDKEVAQVAEALVAAETPMLVAGNGAGFAEAADEIEALSYLLAAPVYGYSWMSCAANTAHPLFQDILPHTVGKVNAAALKQADVLLTVGAPLAFEIYPAHDGYVSGKLVQLEAYAGALNKPFKADIAFAGDMKASLKKIIAVVQQLRKTDYAERRKKWEENKIKIRAAREAGWKINAKNHPLPMMQALAKTLPKGVFLFEESITTQPFLRHAFPDLTPENYLPSLSACLGSGWPGSIGAAVAKRPQKMVAVSADGTAMYVPQALWTAAHHGLDILFIVLNNATYQVLKYNIDMFRNRAGSAAAPYPHMDLEQPALDFSALAKSMGVPAFVAATPEEVAGAVQAASAVKGPALIDLRIAKLV